jgi:hypothetical protein
MDNFYIIIIIAQFFCIISLIYFLIKIKNNQNNILDGNMNKNDKLYFKSELQQAHDFFNQFLKIKFEFYLLNDLMPQLLLSKDLTPTFIQEVKQKYFVDVSTGLNENYYELLGDLYTKPGLQLYIHQTFLTYLNKSQLQFKDDKKIDKRIIDAVMGS